MAYQGGIVAWVAFWAICGQGFGAETLAKVTSFGLAYMMVILVEPLIDLAVLAMAKRLNSGARAPFSDKSAIQTTCHSTQFRETASHMDRIRRLISTLGVALTLVAALSLAAAGGAHRMDRSDASAQAFAAVYGVSAEICGDDQGTGAVNGDCPVCPLVGAALFPEPITYDLATELRYVAAVVLPQSQRAIQTPTDPARSLRGPPVV